MMQPSILLVNKLQIHEELLLQQKQINWGTTKACSYSMGDSDVSCAPVGVKNANYDLGEEVANRSIETQCVFTLISWTVLKKHMNNYVFISYRIPWHANGLLILY